MGMRRPRSMFEKILWRHGFWPSNGSGRSRIFMRHSIVFGGIYAVVVQLRGKVRVILPEANISREFDRPSELRKFLEHLENLEEQESNFF